MSAPARYKIHFQGNDSIEIQVTPEALYYRPVEDMKGVTEDNIIYQHRKHGILQISKHLYRDSGPSHFAIHYGDFDFGDVNGWASVPLGKHSFVLLGGSGEVKLTFLAPTVML